MLTDRELNVYEGEFKNGFYHGKGKYFINDNRTIEGVWECGRIKSSINQI